MIYRFPKIFLLFTAFLSVGTVATLQRIDAHSSGITRNMWILLGLELGTLLCICLCSLRETYLLQRKIRFQNDQLKRQALHDYLTGCYNRRALFSLLGEMELSGNENIPLGCLMIDIDYFKRINDTFGHVQGDKILKDIVKFMQSVLGETGYLARYGGDEFCVLLPRSDKSKTLKIAQRLRKSVEDAVFTTDSGDENPSPVKITLSIGVTTVNSLTATIDEIIAAVDDALYKSKQAGRNRISEDRCN